MLNVAIQISTFYISKLKTRSYIYTKLFSLKLKCLFLKFCVSFSMLFYMQKCYHSKIEYDICYPKKLFEALKICTQRLKLNHLELESIFSTFFLFLNAFHVFQILLSCVKTRKGKENFQGWLLRLFEKTN